MKTARLQAAFARKREAEHIRTERCQETNRYFDHWGKVTSRFQVWTNPEYYENAEKSLKEQKENQIKEEKLNVRREKLRKLLEIENQQNENELQAIILRKNSPSVMLSGRRSKYDSIDINVLEKIKEKRADEMRRLKLEAKLYNKWRNPANGITLSTTPLAIFDPKNEHTNTKTLFESKSNNEVMAKLNWLDKQIVNQMRREDEEKEAQKLNVKLQEEARKREEIQRERQLIRESEIKELRVLQENHVSALKQREQESTQLLQDEEHLRHLLKTIENELKIFKSYEKLHTNLNNNTYNLPHNISKIKILFRQLADEFNQNFQKDIECLNRLKLLYSFARHDTNPSDQIRLTTIEQLIHNFQSQFNAENFNQSDICNMYESEAKINYKKCQESWYNQERLRKQRIIELLEHDRIHYEAKLNENIKQQNLIIEIRETHLSAIENSNEKLKMLINNMEATPSAAIKNDQTKMIKNKEFNNNSNNKKKKQYNDYENHKNLRSSSVFNFNCNDNDEDDDDEDDCRSNCISSRSSSRISNKFDLNSYREESANSFHNTHSRIFGWADDDNNSVVQQQQQQQQQQQHKKQHPSNTSDDMQSNGGVGVNFNRKKPIETNGITNSTIDNNGNTVNRREDLIRDLRENTITNHRNSISNNNNNNSKSRANNSFNITDCFENDSKITNNDLIELNRKNFESKLNISNGSDSINLNGSLGPKFGKKKVAWT